MIERGQSFKVHETQPKPKAKFNVEPTSFRIEFRSGMSPAGVDGALKHVGWRVFSTAVINVQGVGVDKKPPHDAVVIGTTHAIGRVHVQLYPVYAPANGSKA